MKTEISELLGSRLGVAMAVRNPRVKRVIKQIANYICRKQHLFSIHIYHGSTICIVVDDVVKEDIGQLIMENNNPQTAKKP